MIVCPNCGRENPADARFCNSCASPLARAEPRGEVRKTVTVVFTDVTGSTALGERLDPESTRRVMARYFEEMKGALAAHGGTVEKFIGDAVMAVFGIPTVHEDDALRAVRAAAEMRDRLAALNEELERDRGVRIETRTGINTGEVVAGEGQTLVTGDAVNVAARLEQAAGPGEILIGDLTRRLTVFAVETEPVEALDVKGKSAPVAAHRLRAVLAGAPAFARRLDSPLVGRENELAQLCQAYRRVAEERTCYLFTVLGPAGMGKSRLSGELLTKVRDEATLLVGRCLPYGDGITYWPLFEIVQQLGGDDGVRAALRGADEGEAIADRVLATVGASRAGGSGEETFWAVRKLFEAVAQDRPLVLVLDDLHWAETTFLDLVDHVADWSREAPILLVCLARPEFLELRSGWGGGKLNATSILLEPLSAAEAETLIDNLLGGTELEGATRARIRGAAEGNPLFVEQMLALLAEEDTADATVPPTIQALLAARLDRLAPDERAVLERASVVGKEFWRGAVAELSQRGIEVGPALQLLVRKELIRPHRSDVPGEDGFRFRNMLIRDAAYEAMPKELRGELHERFANWLSERLPELDEIVGYHLEQAFRYREQLGPVDTQARELALRAGARLGTAGHRAVERSDVPASVNLLSRAVEFLAGDPARRLELLPELGYALFEAGELERTDEVFADAAVAASAGERPELGARAQIGRIHCATMLGTGLVVDSLVEIERQIEILLEADDALGLAEAYFLEGKFRSWTGNSAGGYASLQHAAEAARRAASPRLEAEVLSWQMLLGSFGYLNAEEGLRRCEELLGTRPGAFLESWVLVARSYFLAMRGRIDEARRDIALGLELQRELGMRLHLAASSMFVAAVELQGRGDPRVAEEAARSGADVLQQLGEKGYLSTVAAYLAEALYRLERDDEAERFTRMSEEATAADDVESQVRWRITRAKVAARKGRLGEAESLAREGEGLASRTDDYGLHADALMDLAEVLCAADRGEETRPLAEKALRLYERKGHLVGARRAQALLDELSGEVLAEVD